MREMNTGMELELRLAAAAARTRALRSGHVPARAVALDAEARVKSLMVLTSGMFGLAVGVSVVVGMLLV